ncbi:MAG: Acetylornithine aminotransferase [Alphaproteobacteria bacterium MarineAlpha5_Bin10]|nr:MAG: Acetylornithine aminotransferase [Alphaproteobacteria bacterium MarineAlpha5_Bin10]|tara:strand:- start:15529 stop:16674 length:1146 start_codon:yes stop_codon:yes gene_type:complete
MPTYGERNLEFISGKGVYLFTKDKKKYLDFGSGIAVNSLGHCNPKLIKSIKKQSERLWHTSNLYSSSNQEKYAKRLCLNTFADRVFFTNSGVESIECGIKMIRKYFYSKNQRNKNRIITFEGAFHGRSIAAISAQKNKKYMSGFGPFLNGFDQVPFDNNIISVKNAISDKTAGVLIETIQGEGGIRPADIKFLKELRKLCNKKNMLLFIDEIQCGFGRSGKLFSYEWAKIKPDILAVAKGIGSGFPMGACLASEKVSKFMIAGTHGSTYGGNPLSVSVGSAVLDELLRENFLKKVDDISRYLWQKLIELKKQYNEIVEIRGAGLLLGIKTRKPNHIINKMFQDNHLLTICAGDNVIRLAPPLIINKTHVDEAIRKIKKSLE